MTSNRSDVFLEHPKCSRKMAESTKRNVKENPSKNHECSIPKCIFINESSKNIALQCRKCHRYVHYRCSRLPAYQIQLCLSFKERSYQCPNCIKVSPEIFKELEISDEAVQNDTEKINDKTIQNIEKSKQNARPFEEETQQEIIKKRIDGLEEKFEELLVKTSQIEIRNDLRNLSYAGVTKQENTTSSSIEN